MEFILNFLCTFSSSTNSNTNHNFHYSQRHMMESVFMALHFYDFVDLIFIKFFYLFTLQFVENTSAT